MCIMHCKECIKECTPTGVDGCELPFAWAAVDVSVHERVPFLERVMLFGPLEYNATVCVCVCVKLCGAPGQRFSRFASERVKLLEYSVTVSVWRIPCTTSLTARATRSTAHALCPETLFVSVYRRSA